VNAVNAPKIAEERGIEVTEEKTRQTEDFQSLVTVTVGDGEDEIGACGTLFAGDDPRLVRLDGYRVDAIPHGQMLVVRNYDRPGVIGLIGTVLGDNDINIAGMFNGRETLGGEAMTVYNLDEPVPDEVVAEIRADERIIDVKGITLGNGEDG
jgi:D-3-phosphoglycerate dehydrogenase